MTDSSPEEVRAIDGRMQAALSEMFRVHYEGSFLTKFVVLAEVIDPDGNQSMWESHADGMGAWELMGFLEFAKFNVQSALQRMDDEEDD